MKKTFTQLLTVALLISCFAVSAFADAQADDEERVKDFAAEFIAAYERNDDLSRYTVASLGDERVGEICKAAENDSTFSESINGHLEFNSALFGYDGVKSKIPELDSLASVSPAELISTSPEFITTLRVYSLHGTAVDEHDDDEWQAARKDIRNGIQDVYYSDSFIFLNGYYRIFTNDGMSDWYRLCLYNTGDGFVVCDFFHYNIGYDGWESYSDFRLASPEERISMYNKAKADEMVDNIKTETAQFLASLENDGDIFSIYTVDLLDDSEIEAICQAAEKDSTFSQCISGGFDKLSDNRSFQTQLDALASISPTDLIKSSSEYIKTRNKYLAYLNGRNCGKADYSRAYPIVYNGIKDICYSDSFVFVQCEYQLGEAEDSGNAVSLCIYNADGVFAVCDIFESKIHPETIDDYAAFRLASLDERKAQGNKKEQTAVEDGKQEAADATDIKWYYIALPALVIISAAAALVVGSKKKNSK